MISPRSTARVLAVAMLCSVPLLVLAGKEYGSGSSRDWAAKGTCLLGVRAVLAESYERIHRSNLVGVGVLPLEFLPGESTAGLGLTGEEVFETRGLPALLGGALAGDRNLTLGFLRSDGSGGEVRVRARIDTPQEALYYQHGGVLPFVLRKLLTTTAGNGSAPHRSVIVDPPPC
jgi:aconitate hydratase